MMDESSVEEICFRWIYFQGAFIDIRLLRHSVFLWRNFKKWIQYKLLIVQSPFKLFNKFMIKVWKKNGFLSKRNSHCYMTFQAMPCNLTCFTSSQAIVMCKCFYFYLFLFLFIFFASSTVAQTSFTEHLIGMNWRFLWRA